MLNSAKLVEMTGDFDVDPKSQLCGLGVEANRGKEPSDDLSSKQPYSFPNAFQPNGSKSSCRGDANDEHNSDNDNGLCRQGLGDQASQSRLPPNSAYCSDHLLSSTTSDSVESSIEAMKGLSLKTDNISAFHNKSRDAPFPGMHGEVNPFAFERSQSAQKFEGCNFLGDSPNINPNGKSRSTPESNSGLDSAYSSANPRSQLLNDSENPPLTSEGHLGGPNGSYWSRSDNGQLDDMNSPSNMSLNNLSPLLTNLLFQQSANAPVSTNSGPQPNQPSTSSAVAKRAITGGHQSMRPPISRPPGWNPTTTSAFESGLMNNGPDPSMFCPPTTSSGFPTSKPPGWMGNFSSQGGNSYPWAPSTSSQQGPFKPNFGDMNSGSFSSGGNGMRFGMNSGLPGMGPTGFPKGTNSSNPASIYSMFPKRAPHRMMAHWQQQQHHQQHLQQAPGSMLNKQHNSDFPVTTGPPFGGQDSIPSSVLNQKIPHSSFGPLGSNPGVNSLSNNLMTNSGEGLGSDKFSSLDNVRGNYNIDQHLLELMKSMDSSGNPPSSLLEDLSLSSMQGMDSYHGNLHPLSSMPQSRASMMPPSAMQSQGMHGMGNAYSSLPGMPPREEGYSRKVFVGGLPPDIDEEEITTAFRRFGALIVDWPHKTESKAYFPPKGYCFLLFQEEQSVQDLINACIVDEGKYYWCVSSPTMKDKPVQIRPWNLADSDFVMDGSQTLDPRKTIFVGGVPRPLRAIELALIMDRLYGGVCYAGIDIDPELKYPKGAGRVAFSNQQSYIAAISARFVQLQHNDIDKRVEVKPYVLDNQMCDECQGTRCGGKFAPLFCANVTCLQYYCEQCWIQIHSRQGREYHKPLVKEGAERPRPALYRW